MENYLEVNLLNMSFQSSITTWRLLWHNFPEVGWSEVMSAEAVNSLNGFSAFRLRRLLDGFGKVVRRLEGLNE